MDDKELDRILNAPEPKVIVNRDGSCTPVADKLRETLEWMREQSKRTDIGPSRREAFDLCRRRLETALAEAGAGQGRDWEAQPAEKGNGYVITLLGVTLGYYGVLTPLGRAVEQALAQPVAAKEKEVPVVVTTTSERTMCTADAMRGQTRLAKAGETSEEWDARALRKEIAMLQAREEIFPPDLTPCAMVRRRDVLALIDAAGRAASGGQRLTWQQCAAAYWNRDWEAVGASDSQDNEKFWQSVADALNSRLAATAAPELSEVRNILSEVCQILDVKLGPGLARYVPLIAKAREAAALLRASQAGPQPKVLHRGIDYCTCSKLPYPHDIHKRAGS